MTVSEMIDRLRLVPSGARQYTCSTSFAKHSFGIGIDALDDLVQQGLPHKNVDGDCRFEYRDLHHLGLRLGTARMYLWGLSRMAQSLERFANEHRTRS